MDSSSTLEKRYSFNMSQGNPVAESTHLNGSSSFSWGTSMSPKHRSYSSLCINNSNTNCNNKSIASPKSKYITKIDARIAADVQSKGLASRIVKYHECGTRLNRSLSAQNLYSKPGQFPAVTLKKTILPYRATKQELSMIRIPPPDKSSFYGNTISSLLRSSSVMGLQSKRSEDLSTENRPIIHPPPTESDMAPTRSVLDVLKEISRKRINNEDLDSEETSKKYCNRPGNDILDTVNSPYALQPNIVTSSLPCQRFKRQRDSTTAHQGVLLHETKTSPEQSVKRVCNYNNDITSSLSSSLKSKRSSATHNSNNQTMHANIETYEMHKSKGQRDHDNKNKNNIRVDMRFENLESISGKVDAINPITPIPATPCVQHRSKSDEVVPKQTLSESLNNSDQQDRINLIPAATKPRLTLFNKSCDDIENLEENTNDSNDLDVCAGIPFVKPKKITSKNGFRNPIMERTQKSKLALMLSGLRGELYQNIEVDVCDSSNEKLETNKDNTININIKKVESPIKSTNTMNTLPTVTSFSNVGPQDTSNSANKKLSPLVGLKLTQPNSSSENLTNILSVDGIKSTETKSKPNVPVLGGFSVGTATLSPSLVNTSSNNVFKDCKTTIPILSTPTNKSNILNFEKSSQLTPTFTLDDKIKEMPVNVQHSTNNNMPQYPAVCAAITVLTTSTSTSSNMSSSLTASKVLTCASNVNTSIPAVSTPTQHGDTLPCNSGTKPNNAFSFNVAASTSLPITTTSVPIVVGNSTSSTVLTKTPSTSIEAPASSTLSFCAAAASPTVSTKTSLTSAASTSALSFSAAATSKNLVGLTSMPSAIFQSTHTPTSNGGVSFNIDGNLTATSSPTFVTNTFSTIRTQPTSSCFSFSSDTKNPSSSSGGQNNQGFPNQTGNNVFNLNNSAPFGSQCLNTQASVGSATVFGSNTKSSENNIFSSSNTPAIFSPNSVKNSVKNFESSDYNKSVVLATPTVFGGNSTNSSISTPFNFGSKSFSVPTTDTKNASSAPGGFSFSSAMSNSAENGAFGFGIKSTVQTNAENNTFSSSAGLTSQNKSFTFGLSTNKPDNSAGIFGVAGKESSQNTSQSGFSFVPVTSMSTSTFTFGAANDSSQKVITGANNSSTGFTFGATAASPPSTNTNNKLFSFDSLKPIEQIQSAPTSSTHPLNIFGLGGDTKTAQLPGFNFNSGSSTNLKSNAPTVNNIFAPPPGDRPIRRATRRLQK